jgi:ABC-2 type transport system permease protein
MQAPQRNTAQRIRYYIGLYGMYLKMYFRTMIEYRADTWVAFLGGLFAQVSSLLFLESVFRHIPQLAGWSYYELLFIFSVSLTASALNIVFLNAPFSIHGYIRRGTMDMLLIRPASTLFQAVSMSQEINGIGSAVTGLAIMGYAIAHLNLDWSGAQVLFLGVAILSGMLIKFAVLLIIVVIAFWLFEIRSLLYPATWLFDFTQYPVTIIHPVLRGLMTYLLPFAMGTFYPAAFLLRPEEHSLAVFAPLVVVLVLCAAFLCWKIGLKRYESASG